MRKIVPLLPLLLITACNQKDGQQEQQPGVVSNIVDQTMPEVRNGPTPANVITPIEAPPSIDTPPPPPAPDGLIPVAIQGRWTGMDERCGDRAADLELSVAPDELVFHESVGKVKAVRTRDNGLVAVDAAFTGEGQSWTRTLQMRPSADGKTLTITNDGTAVTRKRC
ncbi:hypothetical protein [Sphingobium sp.]|uniref:hypothetical protein n=1 Tax=Sphingobium sp. TaxID=1912891 RepID=UPI002B9B0A62|nr:hypothetical protein [Sphingobium sp.]HUD91137.1 hypothetical protein [Sphingobium sp.]